MKNQFYIVLAMVLVIFISVFAIVNVEPVVVNYIFWQGQSPLILVILGSFFMGMLLMLFSSTMRFRRLRKKYEQLEKEKNEIEIKNESVEGK